MFVIDDESDILIERTYVHIANLDKCELPCNLMCFSWNVILQVVLVVSKATLILKNCFVKYLVKLVSKRQASETSISMMNPRLALLLHQR